MTHNPKRKIEDVEAEDSSSSVGGCREYEARKLQFRSLIQSFHSMDGYGKRAFAAWLNKAHPDFWKLQNDNMEDMPVCLVKAARNSMAPPAHKSTPTNVKRICVAAVKTLPGPKPRLHREKATARVAVFNEQLHNIVDFLVGPRLGSMLSLFRTSIIGVVCKSFYAGVAKYVRERVKIIDLTRDLSLGASLTDAQLAMLLARAPNLEELKLRYCSRLTSAGLRRILLTRYCPKLRVLQLGRASTKKSVDQRCSHRFSEDVAMAIADSCPSLEVLNVNLMNCCSDTAIQAMTVKCPRLRALHIGAQSSNLTDAAFNKLVPLGSRAVGNSAVTLPFMRQLSLFGCRYLTDAGAATIAKCLPGLSSLNLEACHNISNAALALIAKNCVRLETLCLSGLNIDDDSIVDLASQRATTLRNLDVSECTSLTDRSIAAVAAHIADRLQTIDLSFVHGFTDNALLSLAKHCPNLRHVVILETEFGFAATTQLLRRCGPRLKDITLGVCVETAAGKDAPSPRNTQSPSASNFTILSSIAAYCPELKSLDFSGDVVSAVGGHRVAAELRSLVQKCQKLQSLTLNSCDLGDVDMHFLLGHSCQKMASLQLYACSNLTPNAFVLPSQASCCSHLAFVKIANCANLCGAGEVETMKKLIGTCCRKKLWISFCGQGETSQVAPFLVANKCHQYWMKTEKHKTGPDQYIVNVEIIPRHITHIGEAICRS